MQINLDTYGTYLGVSKGCFSIKTDGKTETMAPRYLDFICLSRGTSISSDALLLALQSDIPVLLTDRIGRTLGRFWSGRFGSIATIRKHQALFATCPQGLEWAAETIARKLDGQAALLQRLLEKHRLRQPYWSAYRKAAGALPSLALQFRNWNGNGEGQLEQAKKSFRGWEGTASRMYFNALSAGLPDGYRFERRSRHPAFDRFNSLLNYLYAILYSRVETALFKAGLDPSMGVLHADQYNKPVFTYDFIEPYRAWADEVAFGLCSGHLLPEGSFEQPDEKTGWLIARPGKAIVIEAMLRFLEETQVYRDGRKRKRINHINRDAVRLANDLKKFKP